MGRAKTTYEMPRGFRARPTPDCWVLERKKKKDKDWSVEGYYGGIDEMLRGYFRRVSRLPSGSLGEAVERAARCTEQVLREIDQSLTLEVKA